ncbi:MAG: hypothetical protein Kow00114_00400 [Kiloniellaceae bacterium]
MTDATARRRLATEEANSQLHRGEAQERRCLRCQSAFHSEWAGERVCVRCKSSSTWRSGIPVRAGTSGGRR